MSVLQTFRHYTICQDKQGATVEVWRDADEVCCLAFDNKHRHFVELHVGVAPPERSQDAAVFLSAVHMASPLRHPNLLGVIEGGEDEGANYYLTEFLDGERLDSWVARCQPVPPWLALFILHQLVEGLAVLSSHPRLLAGVEVFHAGLTLTGPHPRDLQVKLCDLGLSRSSSVSSEPRFVEARAIHEAGRLLLYMLTGSLAAEEGLGEVNQLPHLGPELVFLLRTWFEATQPHHPRTLGQLKTLLGRCLHDLPPEAGPPSGPLPEVWRPKMPLAAHLPDGTEAAEPISNDFTVEGRPIDAADPYRIRGTERSTRRPANVQILPPEHLLPPEYFQPALEKACHALAGRREPALLSPLACHLEGPVPLVVEELPGRYHLASLQQGKAPMNAVEVLFLLRKIEAAWEAAQALDLPLHWRCPALVPVHFREPQGAAAFPTPAELAACPLTQWPEFDLKIRTWPISLEYTQPHRFRLENLLPRDPAVIAAARIAAPGDPPTSRDYALLALWLMGGSAKLTAECKPLLYPAAAARGPDQIPRQEFLAALARIVDPPEPAPDPASAPEAPADPPPAAPLPSSIAADPLPAPPEQQEPLAQSGRPFTSPMKGGRKASRRKNRKSGPSHGSSAPAAAPADDPADAMGFGPESGDIPAEEPGPAASMGFAEALFGSGRSGDPRDHGEPEKTEDSHPGALWPSLEAAGNLPPWEPESGNDSFARAEPPLGFMEAAGHTEPWNPEADLDLQDQEGRKATSRWMLLLIVILIAAGIAALMAHFSGQAIWLQPDRQAGPP